MFAVLGCRAIVSTQKYYYDTMTVIVLSLSNFLVFYKSVQCKIEMSL